MTISAAGVVALHVSGKLQFHEAKTFHSGQYSCVTTNNKGSKRADIYVQVVDGRCQCVIVSEVATQFGYTAPKLVS